MSLDLCFELEHSCHDLNITYNLCPLFCDLLSNRFTGGFWAEWRRREESQVLRGADMYALFRDAWFALRRMPYARAATFEPPNGWGSVRGADKFLLRCAALCRLYPTSKLKTYR